MGRIAGSQPIAAGIGEHGRDGKGDLPEYPDRGVHLRAICAAGKQDVAWAALTPTLPGVEMIGASSDHLIVDVEGCGGRVKVGGWLDFRCGYMAVLDATTGQNGLIQAKQFKEAAGITGIVLTKLDGSAKGGIVIAIAQELQVPVKFIGVGEGIDDLMPFEAEKFVEALV